ncbi:MAG: ABC transporter substrate-binding protein [Pseudomonadota bacterium]|nr:ABC transporter substrate-binding protein [Pseudomonadota bacterium]
MLPRRTTFLLTAFVLIFCQGPTLAAAGPAEQVRETVDDVLVVLRDPNLERSDRHSRVRATIGNRFDFPLMARSALSVNWKKATQEQKRRFVDLFTELLLLTYIGRLDEYRDEAVRYGDEKIRDKRATVSTFVVSRDKEIPVDYRLRRKADDWLVYDVVIEHVSQVSNYRNSYLGIVEDVGIDGLLSRLEAKVDGLQSGKAVGENPNSEN